MHPFVVKVAAHVRSELIRSKEGRKEKEGEPPGSNGSVEKPGAGGLTEDGQDAVVYDALQRPLLCVTPNGNALNCAAVDQQRNSTVGHHIYHEVEHNSHDQVYSQTHGLQRTQRKKKPSLVRRLAMTIIVLCLFVLRGGGVATVIQDVAGA